MMQGTVVAYRGPSMLRPEQTVTLALSGFDRASENMKTGPMVQAWVLVDDTPPHVAQKTGQDQAVCGMCPLRPANKEALKSMGLQPCYVRTYQGPRSVYETAARLPVQLTLAMTQLATGDRGLRVTAYGDPAAIPADVWAGLLVAAPFRTGYTHQWRKHTPLRGWVQASVESLTAARKAQARGWGTFRVMRPGEATQAGEYLCPASLEGGKRTTCNDCRLCDGTNNVAIYAH